jgi:hypothetical protein
LPGQRRIGIKVNPDSARRVPEFLKFKVCQRRVVTPLIFNTLAVETLRINFTNDLILKAGIIEKSEN